MEHQTAGPRERNRLYESDTVATDEQVTLEVEVVWE